MRIVEKETAIFLKTYQDIQQPFLLFDNGKVVEKELKEINDKSEEKIKVNNAIAYSEVIKQNNKSNNCNTANKPSFSHEEEDVQYNGIKIRKRKDCRWEAKKQINGNRISVVKKTQAEVLKTLKELFPKEIIKPSKSMLLYDYIDFWYKTYKEPFLKKSRRNNYNCVINNQIKPFFENKELKIITPIELNKSITKIPNTRQKEDATQFIRNIFKMAYKDKYIKNNYYEELIKYQHKREEGVALTIQQRNEVIKQAKTIDGADIFIFYMFTGARASEVLSINPQTDITNDLLHLPGTKTDLSDRWIPIFKPVANILKHKDLTKSKLFDVSYTTLKRKIETLREKCGFHVNIKDFRTTFGTICAEMGINEKVIAKWMGHTSTKTTQKFYIKVLSEFEKQEISKFNKGICATFDDTFLIKTKNNQKFNQYIARKINKTHNILMRTLFFTYSGRLLTDRP